MHAAACRKVPHNNYSAKMLNWRQRPHQLTATGWWCGIVSAIAKTVFCWLYSESVRCNKRVSTELCKTHLLISPGTSFTFGACIQFYQHAAFAVLLSVDSANARWKAASRNRCLRCCCAINKCVHSLNSDIAKLSVVYSVIIVYVRYTYVTSDLSNFASVRIHLFIF